MSSWEPAVQGDISRPICTGCCTPWNVRCGTSSGDGDVVEGKNLVRQNFTPADLGENKAQVLAERYSTVFGMETEYVPDFVETEERLKELLTPMYFWKQRPNSYNQDRIEEMVILIGAVDNNKSRQLCHQVFGQAKELIYIDSGNG